MFNLFKYLPSLLLLKDVTKAFQEEQGKEKPFYVSRRFIGAVLAVGGSVATIALGVTVDSQVLDSIAEKVETIATAVIALWGLIMGLVGIFQKSGKTK